MNKMEATTVSSNNKEIYIGIALIFASGLFLFSSITPGHDWGGDFSAYMHQGKALASGSLDRLEMLVQHRIQKSSSEWIIGPDFYPWGFPALLSIVILIFGESLIAMKALIVCFLLGTQVVTYFLLRGRIPIFACFSIAFLVGLNSFVFTFKENILSDIPFTFFTLLTLLLCRIYLLDRQYQSTASLIGIGLAMLAAYSIRTHAVALFPTVALVQLIGKSDLKTQPVVIALFRGLKRLRPRDFIPYVIFVLGVAGLVTLLTDPIESYIGTGHMQSDVGFFEKIFNAVRRGLLYYGVLPNHLFQAPTLVYVFFIVPLLMIGVVRGAIRNVDLLVFVIFHMTVLVLFPGRQGLRFILPIFPIMFFFLFVGSQEVTRWLRLAQDKARSGSIATNILASLLVLCIAGPAVASAVQSRLSGNANEVEPGPYAASSKDIFDFIRKNIGEDDSIVFWKPRVLTYFTDRKSAFCVPIEDITSGEHRYILAYSGDYEFQELGELLVDTISENPDRFRAVYKNSDFVLYEIIGINARQGD